MPEVLREVGTERASTGDEDGRWSFSPVRVLRLAQDQYSIDVVRGDYAEVYYARRATHIDAQSEVTAAPALRLMDSAWQALLRLWQADRGHDRWWEDSFSSPELPCGLTEDCDGQSLPAEVDIPALEAEEIMQRLTGSVEWAELRDVILQAEDIEFTVDQSQQIAPRLLELAQCHRDSSDPQDRPVVWAAIRTGASMLRSTDAARLLPLLEPGHAIETTTVTVKMLGRVFEAQPPIELGGYPVLTEQLCGIAEALLNPYAIASSQSAANAQLAIYALAAMASPAVIDVVRLASRLASWFVQQTGRDLRQLQEYWNDCASEPGVGPRQLLNQALLELGSN